MRRINLNYAGGMSSILLDLKTKKVFVYENDFVEVHNLYGGCRHYESRSGASGAGHIDYRPEIVVVNVARTTCNEQTPTVITNKDGRELFVYMMYDRDPEITYHKFVISDGERVAMVGAWSDAREVINAINNFDELFAVDEDGEYLRSVEEIEFRCYVPTYSDGERVRNVKMLNVRGIDVQRFVDFRSEHKQTEHILKEYCPNEFNNSFTAKKLHVRFIAGSYYKLRDRLFTEKYDTLDEVSGWEAYRPYDDCAYMFYRREGDNIYAFIENERERYELKHSKFAEYEKKYNLFEFYSKDIDEVYDEISYKLLYKKRLDFLYERRHNAHAIELIPDSAVFTLSDSYAAGNCEPGTLNFIEEYELLEEGEDCITMKELREHPKFSEMLKRWDFKKVLMSKLDDESIYALAETSDESDEEEAPRRERRARAVRSEAV
jgi:hypothetical protein